MSGDQDRTDHWGVDESYLDSEDRPQRIPEEVRARLRELVGPAPEDQEQVVPLVVRVGDRTA
ncbi:MAG: hypothetical protein ACR2KN_07630, partial [Geodermatophilaceae bacterium]